MTVKAFEGKTPSNHGDFVCNSSNPSLTNLSRNLNRMAVSLALFVSVGKIINTVKSVSSHYTVSYVMHSKMMFNKYRFFFSVWYRRNIIKYRTIIVSFIISYKSLKNEKLSYMYDNYRMSASPDP